MGQPARLTAHAGLAYDRLRVGLFAPASPQTRESRVALRRCHGYEVTKRIFSPLG